MKAKALAVLGTDTGVGKTVVTGALALALRREGREPAIYKPVASGCAGGKGRLISHDALWFKRVIGLPDEPEAINPICYRRPLAPWPAARLEGKRFPEQKAIRGFSRLLASGRTLLVEGIGGALVPLTRRLTIADFCARLRLPAVLVGRAGLGSINHTLLSLEALSKRRVEVRGVILNLSAGRDPAEASNPQVIRAVGGVKVLAVLPKISGASRRKGVASLSRRLTRGNLSALFGWK